jgi:abortive phage resistance protein AbiGi (putative antitoxin)
MNISSNSLFHFTDNIDTIFEILTNKFYGSYCKETLHYKEEKAPMIIPMICFCDIPLKTISNYAIYGKYGIGLTKEWGIKNKLNPVLYLEKNSELAHSLVESFYGSVKLIERLYKLVDEQLERVEILKKTPNVKEMDECLKELDNLEITLNSLNYNRYSLFFTKHYEDDFA